MSDAPLVPSPEGTSGALAPVGIPDLSKPAYWCSVPGTTPESKMLRYAAAEGDSEKMDQVVNTEIVITNLLIKPITKVEPTGEVKDLLRMVLLLADGKMVGTCSKVVMSALRTMMTEWGLPPWEPGIRVKVTSVQIDPKRRTFKLLPVLLPAISAEKKK